MKEERIGEKSIFIDTLPESPVSIKSLHDYHAVSVSRATKRKKAQMTIEIPDDLAEGLLKQMINYFSDIPIRQLVLSWVAWKTEK